MLKQLILYSLVILVVFGCGSSKNNKHKGSSPEKADSTVNKDTMQTMTVRPPHPRPALPPGTARITGHILSVNDSTMTINVAASEYGPSTPAIGSGTSLTIFTADSKNLKKLKEDKKIVCLINYRQFLTSDSTNSRWALKKISSLENSQ